MVDNTLMAKLVDIACNQLQASTKLKRQRMKTVNDIENLYNNKVLDLVENRINIPFPIMSGQIDTLLSKIDNLPTVDFLVKKAPQLAEKVKSAWKQDSSSMRAGWERKDRAEKKLALISGRGISKVYASSVSNKYQAHYEVVDYHNFHCEGTRGHLDDNLYCGEEGIFRTGSFLKLMAEKGIYARSGVDALLKVKAEGEYKQYGTEQQNSLNRMKSLELTPDMNAYVGQDVFNLCEWQLEYNGVLYYLVFEPTVRVGLRAEKSSKVFGHTRKLWVSWAVNHDEYNFWSKGAGDDIMPTAEAMRLLLNEALNNQQRRNRPMRIVDGTSFQDVNEIMDYVPDNVIISNPNKNRDIFTIETPEITTTVNLVQFLNNFISEKTGITGAGVDEKDAAVGVYYGNLQQEADRIGIINKSYSSSYAEKAYNYFWGLKTNITEPLMVKMLGKDGYHWEELCKEDFVSLDDVDDIITSGGNREEQISEVKARRQSDILAQLTGNQELAQKLSPDWIIKTSLRSAGFNEDDISQAMDKESSLNRDLIAEADQAITMIMEGKAPKINRGASTAYIQRLIDYDIDNLDFVKTDNNGNPTGIDRKVLELSKKIRKFAELHVPVAIKNMQRDVRMQIAQQTGSAGQIKLPVSTEEDKQEALSRPFEGAAGSTPEGTASTSQALTNI